jgi:cyclopropane fatty-acyl-phospholipid synthase-like methyltransferase
MPQQSETSARAFYDDLVDRQSNVGVNERHRAILKWLVAAGLRRDHRLLEVGCGIGTQTQLVADFLASGRITAVDISARSIAAARERLKSREQVEFVVGDYLELALPGRFDVVLLPDVIEHIPPQQHPELFRRVAHNLEPDGFVLIHMPDPSYLEYLQRSGPELLQKPVDLPVHTDALCASVYPAGFCIHFLRSYAIWCEQEDYQVVVLRKREARNTFTPRTESARGRWLARCRSWVDRLT